MTFQVKVKSSKFDFRSSSLILIMIHVLTFTKKGVLIQKLTLTEFDNRNLYLTLDFQCLGLV